MLFLAFKIRSGRNWARVIFTILFIAGSYQIIYILPAEAERNIWVFYLSVIQSVMQFTAIVLVFLPSSKMWFKK